MKIITLWQPWATFIALGWKTIETRTHDRFKNLVGQIIGIHAGKQWDSGWRELTFGYLSSEQISYTDQHIKDDFSNRLARGQIICTAKIIKAEWTNPKDSEFALIECNCDWAPNRFGLFLSDIKIIKPITIKGHQGIWNYEFTPEVK